MRKTSTGDDVIKAARPAWPLFVIQMALLAALPLRSALAQPAVVAAAASATQQQRSNVFNDPYLNITRGLPACPVPEPPLLTAEEAREQEHGRVQRGGSCWLAGRCRLHNAYLYDAEIIPRVAIALRAAGRYADTSVWAMGQRRWVWLQGCVATREQADALVQLVRQIDDVEAVIDELMVGTSGVPKYQVAPAAQP